MLHPPGQAMTHAPLRCRAALTSFIEQEDTARMLFYLEGKDLVAVRAQRAGAGRAAGAWACGEWGCSSAAHCAGLIVRLVKVVSQQQGGTFPAPPAVQTNKAPAKLKKKTVYFLKLSRTALTKDALDKTVRRGTVCARWVGTVDRIYSGEWASSGPAQLACAVVQPRSRLVLQRPPTGTSCIPPDPGGVRRAERCATGPPVGAVVRGVPAAHLWPRGQRRKGAARGGGQGRDRQPAEVCGDRWVVV